MQEALQKIAETADIPRYRWHLIGHLQSNKAKKAAGRVCLHSLGGLGRPAAASGRARRTKPSGVPDVLIQVDLAGEATKFGAAGRDAEHCARRRSASDGRPLAGLMLMPPWNDDQEQTRPWFVRLRELRDRS